MQLESRRGRIQLLLPGRRRDEVGAQRGRLLWRFRAGKEPVVDCLLPALLEIGAHPPLLPVIAQHHVSRLVALAEEGAQHLRLGDAVEKRRDERLLEGDGAVVGAAVAPVLQRMGGGEEPARALAGLVEEEPAIDRIWNSPDRLAQVEIGWRSVDRIPGRDYQGVDLAGADLLGER